MKLINSLKTVCDFLLLFTFAALIPSFGKSWVFIAAVLALSFVSTYLLQSIPYVMPLRVLCALLPALGLLIARNLVEIIITSVIILFYLLIVVEEKIEMHYDDYKFWYAIPAVPVIVTIVVRAFYWPVISTSSVCGLLYLILGVLVLRRKRIGSRATAEIKMVNLAEMAGVLTLDVVVCFIIHTVVMAAKDYIVLLFTPIAMIFHFPAYIISVLSDELYLWMRPDYKHEGNTKETAVEFGTGAHDSGIVPTFNGKTGDELAAMIIGAILVISVVILLVWLLYGFWKMLRDMGTETAGKDEIEGGQKEQFRFKLSKRRKRKRGFAATNNEKIRLIYTDYLFFMKACGIDIKRQSTSEEVLADSLEIVDREKAEQLRDLYLRARYNDAAELSDEEVQKAQKLYNYITENVSKA
ncbi:hypothetical protein [Butyrivibrio sp. VCB2006]|uniref:hypothetical protein n=1 Tax=Butyrivibrio sp. VCB2006 TaxID=1280679 RepID=UPI00041BEF5D|nr:hypothetical protein [Butyrivibrio sp. VCB2006]